MKTIQIDYTPTPKQKMFHETDANEVLYGGAAGGGKSKAIVMDALMRCMMYPKTNAYMFRRTYGELEISLIKEAMNSYPPEIYKYNSTRHEMRLFNGSRIYFCHCASVSDKLKYTGAEIHWLYIDELTLFEKEIYDYLKTRLRANVALGITPVVRCASNPGNIGHAWVKQLFVDAAPYGQKTEQKIYSEALNATQVMTTQYIPSLAMDNPHISKLYIAELEKKPKALRDALLYGNWDAFEGQVFVEWKDDPEHYADRRWTHVIDPFPVPLNWPRYMSFDWGYSQPFACQWWTIAPSGCLYLYKEWYGWNGNPNEGAKLTNRQIVEGILKMEEEEIREGIHISRVADPSIFDESRGFSTAQQMEPAQGKPGIFFEKGDNTRIPGKMQLHERLRFDADGRPMLQVFSHCKQFIRTVPALPYDINKPEDVDTHAEDHAYDAVRYLLLEKPLPGAPSGRKKKKVFSPFERNQEDV